MKERKCHYCTNRLMVGSRPYFDDWIIVCIDCNKRREEK